MKLYKVEIDGEEFEVEAEGPEDAAEKAVEARDKDQCSTPDQDEKTKCFINGKPYAVYANHSVDYMAFRVWKEGESFDD